jgi:hypothetical protein
VENPYLKDNMSVKVDLGNLRNELLAKFEEVKEPELQKLVDALQENTPVDTGNARDGWRIEDGKIVNDVEYIEELNAGSSKQAPSHFIERTLLSFQEVEANGVIVTPSN